MLFELFCLHCWWIIVCMRGSTYFKLMSILIPVILKPTFLKLILFSPPILFFPFVVIINDAILLWHYRLGHPNFVYLEKMFPSLFNKNSNPFQCEICQMSKNMFVILILTKFTRLLILFQWFTMTFGVYLGPRTFLDQDGLSPLLMITLDSLGYFSW